MVVCAALAALLGADVITFTFHYPRNYLLFHSPMTEDVARLTAAAHEWATGNVWRLMLILASAIAACLGLRANLIGKSRRFQRLELFTCDDA